MSNFIATLISFVMAFTVAVPAKADIFDPAAVMLDAPRAWEMGYRGAGQVIAFIDSGVNASLPEFAGSIAGGYCIIADSNSPEVCPNGKKRWLVLMPTFGMKATMNTATWLQE